MSASMSKSNEGKAWYQKPENFLVYGGLGLLGWFGLNALDKILPLLNRVLENALYTAGLAAALGIIGFLVVNKDFHKLAWYGYKSAMRWLTGLVIELDPIGIMQSYVNTLKEQLTEIQKGIATLRGQATKLEQLIKEQTYKQEQAMSMAAQARNRSDEAGMRQQMRLQARKSKRAEEASITYQSLHAKILRHIAVMTKILEASKFMIADMEDTIEHEQEKRKAIHASFKAMSAAKRILAADEQREMYDRALQANVEDYHSKLGEITQFMEDSQEFIMTMDLENGVLEEDALSKLDAWEKRSENLMAGGTGTTKYRVEPVHLPTEEEVSNQSFSDLFGHLDK